MAEGSPARKGDALVMTGTGKWSFLFSREPSRKRWKVCGLHFSGSDVFHMTYDSDVFHMTDDSMEGGQVAAAVNKMLWGTEIQLSKDLGGTWLSAEQQPRVEDESGRTVQQL